VLSSILNDVAAGPSTTANACSGWVLPSTLESGRVVLSALSPVAGAGGW
jgi:hypothetical protein